MDGKKEKSKRCPLCNGKMEEGFTALPFLIGEKVAVVRSVPAEICSDCGEAYMKSGAVGRIEILLDRIAELQSEISVVQYRAA